MPTHHWPNKNSNSTSIQLHQIGSEQRQDGKEKKRKEKKRKEKKKKEKKKGEVSTLI